MASMTLALLERTVAAFAPRTEVEFGDVIGELGVENKEETISALDTPTQQLKSQTRLWQPHEGGEGIRTQHPSESHPLPPDGLTTLRFSGGPRSGPSAAIGCQAALLKAG
jgi:hypothetical protein